MIAAPPEQRDPAAPAGAEFKSWVRARASLLGIYNDKELALAVGVSRNTPRAWWEGVQPDPASLYRLSRALGVAPDEMYAWVYLGGPEPDVRPSPEERERVRQEAHEWADSETRRLFDRPGRRTG